MDRLALDDAFNAFGDQTLRAVAAVVGHDDDLIAGTAHFLLQYDKVLGACGQHRDDTVAGSLESLHDGQHGGYAHTTACTDHRPEVLDVGSLAERAYHIGDVLTRLQAAELGRRGPHMLHDERDGAGLRVGFSYGQGDAFTLLANAHNDEVAGLARAGNQWCFDHQTVHLLREAFFADNSVHVCCIVLLVFLFLTLLP